MKNYKDNAIAAGVNKLFWSLGIGYDFSKKEYNRDRKGRFAKVTRYRAAGGGYFYK